MNLLNLNEFAVAVSKLEGGKQEMSIAQIKEVINRIGIILGDMRVEDALALTAKMIKSSK